MPGTKTYFTEKLRLAEREVDHWKGNGQRNGNGEGPQQNWEDVYRDIIDITGRLFGRDARARGGHAR